jgi:hypothetical protein
MTVDEMQSLIVTAALMIVADACDTRGGRSAGLASSVNIGVDVLIQNAWPILSSIGPFTHFMP